jgi:hypothetical protein
VNTVPGLEITKLFNLRKDFSPKDIKFKAEEYLQKSSTSQFVESKRSKRQLEVY